MSVTETQQSLRTAQSSLRNHAGQTSSKDGSLEKNDFMNLFMTQMSHQDPLDPMDSSKMMAQMAQLGSMEQLQNLRTDITSLHDTQREIAKFEALNFLDKEISIKNEGIEMKNGIVKTPLFYNLKQNANNMIARIKNQEGELIAEKQLGLKEQGGHQFTWDGKIEDGSLVGDGKYQVEFFSKNQQGTELPIHSFKKERVSKIEYIKGKPMLQVNDAMIAAKDVLSVDQKVDHLLNGLQPLPYKKEIPLKPNYFKSDKDIQSVK